MLQDENRKRTLFFIEIDKIELLRNTLNEELEEEMRQSSKKASKKTLEKTEEEKEEDAAFEHMGKAVKEMKSLSKKCTKEPLTQSMAGVLSLYQGIKSLKN